MADSRFVNMFITSKNRMPTEKPCDFVMQFPSGLIRAEANQGIKLNVISFHLPNNFYNVNDINNRFDIIVRGNTDINIPITIAQGNYSVMTFRDYINKIASPYFNMTYDSSRNMFSIKSIHNDPLKTIHIKPINCGQFYGLDNMTEFSINAIYKECLYTTNMCSFDKIVLNAYGINPELMSVENIGLNDPDFERSSIILWASRTDIPINGMIKYDNYDGGNSYSYNLYDKAIDAFRLVLTDEYGKLLSTALDYTMLLRFEIYQRDTRQIYQEISQIKEYLKFIYIQMMLLLEYIGILKKK